MDAQRHAVLLGGAELQSTRQVTTRASAFFSEVCARGGKRLAGALLEHGSSSQEAQSSTLYVGGHITHPLHIHASDEAHFRMPPHACGSSSWWLATDEQDSATSRAFILVACASVWIVIMIATTHLTSALGVVRRLPPSRGRPVENTPAYVAQKATATFKSLVVAAAANVRLYQIFVTDPSGPPGDLTTAISEPTGILFTSYELADLLYICANGFLDWEVAVHHIVHIALGWLLRANCGPDFTAMVLMAQESSSVFLNYFLLMRHRKAGHWATNASFLAFYFCFCLWRLILGSYGALAFVLRRHELPANFPSGDARRLDAALFLATALQWYWGVHIGRGLWRRLRATAGVPPSSKGVSVRKQN